MTDTSHQNRLASALVAALLFGLVTVASSCFLFQNDYPNNSCTENYDCFQAAGEVCNKTTGQCETPPDAAPEVHHDAAPFADAAGDGDGDGDGD